MKYTGYLLALCVLGFFACQSDQQSPGQFTESLPQVHPQKISQFQKAGNLYFGHLGYQSIPMQDGSVVLPLRKGKMLLQVSQQGELIKELARSGRGPGEVQDPSFLQQSVSGEILVYDQRNRKVIRYGPDLELVTELTPKSPESATIRAIYPMQEKGQYVIRSSSSAYLFDKDKSPAMTLTPYSTDNGYGQPVTVNTRPVALLMIDGKPAGGREVPYAPSQQLAYSSVTGSLYSYWTASSTIAELSATLDTLNTISLDLPSQRLSDVAYDSIEAETRDRQWETLSEMLPEGKVPVERMIVDPQDRFWLKLNYRGDTQKWLVMDRKGDFQKIIHLPRGSMLTHISEHHLGVRLDNITFALFEPVL